MQRLAILPALLFLAGCATSLAPAVYQHDANGRVRVAHVGFNGMTFKLPAATAFVGPDTTEALDQAYDFYVAFRLHTWKQNARPNASRGRTSRARSSLSGYVAKGPRKWHPLRSMVEPAAAI